MTEMRLRVGDADKDGRVDVSIQFVVFGHVVWETKPLNMPSDAVGAFLQKMARDFLGDR